MDASEYIKEVTDQMRCRKARELVGKELSGHIEDQREAFVAEGMSAEEAGREAVRQMGDAVSVGMEMDRLHRPRADVKALVLLAVLSVAGGLIQYMMRSLGMYQTSGPGAVAGNVWLSAAAPGLGEALTVAAGLLVMTAVYFADYTILGKRPLLSWAALIIIYTFLNAEPLNQISAFNAISKILLLGLTLPLFCGVIYRYRGRGGAGILWSLAWLTLWGVPALNSAVYPGIRRMYVWMIFLGGILTVCFSWLRGTFGGSRKKQALCIAGALAVAAGSVFWFVERSGAASSARLMAFLNPGRYAESAGYVPLQMKEILGRIGLFGRESVSVTYTGDGALTFLTLLERGGILAAALLMAGFLLLFGVMIAGIRKQKGVLGTAVGVGCLVGLALPCLMHVMVNLVLLPLTDIFLPFCYPDPAVSVSCYVLAGFYLSVYRNKDILVN